LRIDVVQRVCDGLSERAICTERYDAVTELRRASGRGFGRVYRVRPRRALRPTNRV